MKKFIAITLCICMMLMTLGTVAEQEHPTSLSLVSTEVLAGCETTIQLIADFPTEIHGLVLSIEYDPQVFRCISMDFGDMFLSDDAMIIKDISQPGICRLGIICPSDGLSGTGILMTMRMSAAFNQIGVHLIRISVIDCFHAPLGEGRTDISPLLANAEIHIINPDVHAALRLARGVMGLLSIPSWGDTDGNGVIDTEDVLWILRRSLCD